MVVVVVVVWVRSGCLGVILWVMLQWVSVGEAPPLPPRELFLGLITPLTLWGEGPSETLLSVWSAPRATDRERESECPSLDKTLRKIRGSLGREISNNQKPSLHNVHLYHNILTLILLTPSPLLRARCVRHK